MSNDLSKELEFLLYLSHIRLWCAWWCVFYAFQSWFIFKDFYNGFRKNYRRQKEIDASEGTDEQQSQKIAETEVRSLWLSSLASMFFAQLFIFISLLIFEG